MSKYSFPAPMWPVAASAPMGFGDEAGAEADEGAETGADIDEDDDETGAGTGTEQPSADEIAETKALERQARAQGWRPKDEYKGEAPWTDAATFLERGAKFRKTMQREIDQLKAGREKDAKLLQQFKDFHEASMKAKDRELDEAIRQAKLQRGEAIRNGEDDAALALDDRIDTLKEEKAKLKAAPEPSAVEIEAENRRKAKAVAEGKEPLPEAMQDWLDDGNHWFRDNPRMRGYALAIGDELRAAGDTSMDREFLDKVTEQMHSDFPEFFKKGKPGADTGNPLRKRAGVVEAGTGGRPTGEVAGRTARDLPKEDRALMKQFVAQGLMTEQQFLKEYNWN